MAAREYSCSHRERNKSERAIGECEMPSPGHAGPSDPHQTTIRELPDLVARSCNGHTMRSRSMDHEGRYPGYPPSRQEFDGRSRRVAARVKKKRRFLRLMKYTTSRLSRGRTYSPEHDGEIRASSGPSEARLSTSAKDGRAAHLQDRDQRQSRRRLAMRYWHAGRHRDHRAQDHDRELDQPHGHLG